MGRRLPVGLPQHHRELSALRAQDRNLPTQASLTSPNGLPYLSWSTATGAGIDELRAHLANKGARYSEIADGLATDPDYAYRSTPDRQALSRHARGTCSAREKLRSA